MKKAKTHKKNKKREEAVGRRIERQTNKPQKPRPGMLSPLPSPTLSKHVHGIIMLSTADNPFFQSKPMTCK